MTIFFSVGEPSGDLHGANLIRELRMRAGATPSGEPWRFVGYGGPKMAAAGAELHEDLTRLAVMWLLRVLLNLHKFIGLKRRAERYFATHRPDAVVLIDYPGFNWHIARVAKKHGIPVYYYGTPQLWGWAPWRVKKMRRTVDHALCKLPFEEPWYRGRGCNATYVGHPYFDELRERQIDAGVVASLQDQPGPLVAILPGSRTQEVKANLAQQLRAAERVLADHPDTRFAIAVFKQSQRAMVERLVGASGVAADIRVAQTPEVIAASTCCIAVSGSVSLELLYHAKPTVIVYAVSRLGYGLQWVFRRVRYITLVNLLTADELFPKPIGKYTPGDPRDAHVLMPEFLSAGDLSRELAGCVTAWLADNAARERRVAELTALRDRIGRGGASQHAAAYLCDTLGVDRTPVHDAA